MDQAERRRFLIEYLLAEEPRYRKMPLPEGAQEQRDLLRSLMNVRPPRGASVEFLAVQDEYLREETAKKGVTDIADLTQIQPDIYLWQGDITTLKCGAVVNAANSGMLGCFAPLHYCIDNAIHTFAGVQLRLKCAEIMEKQGYEEPTGQAKITPAYNLPCDHVIHTVGPIVDGRLTKKHEELLASSYRSCLRLAEENCIKSIAFPCVSTGVFMFPNERAAEIAVQAVKAHKNETHSEIKVIFNVFKELDCDIYGKLLKA